MKTRFILLCMALGMIMLTAGCKRGKAGKALTVGTNLENGTEIVDTTIYGKCGENTAMHTLELIGDDGKVYNFIINMDDSVECVFGGLLAGDRLAIIADVEYGDTIATKVINLTTLLGEWVSLDKNFDIQEGGVVSSHLEAETNPWNSWKICNGQLILNKDTFEILELGADSLYIESKDGVFTYKRKKK